MEEFRKRFKEEAFDLISEMEKGLLELESSTDNLSCIEQIFRVMHSLKGGGGMFGYNEISEFTHHLESVYDLVRTRERMVDKHLIDITFASVDVIKNLLHEELQDSQIEDLTKKILLWSEIDYKTDSPKKAVLKEYEYEYFIRFIPKKDILDFGNDPILLFEEMYSLGDCKVTAFSDLVPSFNHLAPTNCHFYWDCELISSVSIDRIRDIFIFVEDRSELEIIVKSKKEKGSVDEIVDVTHQKITNPTQPQQYKSANGKAKFDNLISSVRVPSEKLDLLMNLVSELVTTQASLNLFVENNPNVGLVSINENVENITRQLRDIAFNISLVPIETLETRFQRLIRDLSTEMGKQIVLETQGLETELDKNIIQVLSDPLMHILRNCIDHGIETPEVRLSRGKPERGTITLSAYYSGSNVMLKIEDDGAGLDPQKIRSKAIERGLITSEQVLKDQDLYNMVFLPGFSTAKQVTDISGRGVGMDVVNRKIAEIRGEVNISSVLGKGTTITIELPLTLSIIDGLLVKINSTHFVVPLSAVDKIYAIQHQLVENSFNNIIVLDGVQIPFYNLKEEFRMIGLSPKIEEVVVVNYEGAKVGLLVDSVVGEYQAVLKPLGKMYKSVELLSGATILGDGTVALVLDVNRIIKKFSQ